MAARDASVRGASSQDGGFTYTINNEGSNTEIFIKNIKQSVTSINQQLTAESETLDNLDIGKEKTSQIEKDEKFAWKTALEEARHITSKEKLKSFKQPLFFKGSDLKKYILDLQTKEIEYYEKKLQSECKRASQKKA
jgi:hypothetical protein